MNVLGLGLGTPQGFQNAFQYNHKLREQQFLREQQVAAFQQMQTGQQQQQMLQNPQQMLQNSMMYPGLSTPGLNMMGHQWQQQGMMPMYNNLFPMSLNYQNMAAPQMNVLVNFNNNQQQMMNNANAYGLHLQEQQVALDLRQSQMQPQNPMARPSVVPMMENQMQFQGNRMAQHQLHEPNRMAAIPQQQRMQAQLPQQNLQAEPQQLVPVAVQMMPQENVDTPPPVLTRQNSQASIVNQGRQMVQTSQTWQVPSEEVSAQVLSTALNEFAKAPAQLEEQVEKKASRELHTVPFDTPSTSTTAETPGPRDLPTPHDVKTDLSSSAEKGKQHCRKCANHNENVLRLGHIVCPHGDCDCPACLETEKMRKYSRNHYHQRRDVDKHDVPVPQLHQELSLMIGQQQQMKMDPMLLTPSSFDSDHPQRMNTSFEKPPKVEPMDQHQQQQQAQWFHQVQHQMEQIQQQIQQPRQNQPIQGAVLGKRIKEEIHDDEPQILGHYFGGAVVDHPIVKKPKVEPAPSEENQVQDKKVKKEVVNEESEQKTSPLAALEAKYGQNVLGQAVQGFQGQSQPKMEPPHTYQKMAQTQMQPNAFAPPLHHFPGTWPPHPGHMETLGFATPHPNSFALQQHQQFQQQQQQLQQQQFQQPQYQQQQDQQQLQQQFLQSQHLQQPQQPQQLQQQHHLQMPPQMQQPPQNEKVQQQLQPIQKCQPEVRQHETVLQGLINENEVARQKETAAPLQMIQDQGFSCAPQPLTKSSSQMNIERATSSAQISRRVPQIEDMPFTTPPSASTSSEEKSQVASDPPAAEPQPAPPLAMRYAYPAKERFYIPDSPVAPPTMEMDDSEKPEDDETPVETDQEPCCSPLTTRSVKSANPEVEDIFRGLGTPSPRAEHEHGEFISRPSSPDCSATLEDSGFDEADEDAEAAEQIEALVQRPSKPKVYKRPLPRFELLKKKGIPRKEWSRWCLTCLAHKSTKMHSSLKDCFFRYCAVCPREGTVCKWTKSEFKHALDLWQTEQMDRLGRNDMEAGEKMNPPEKKLYCLNCRAHGNGKRDLKDHICIYKHCGCKLCRKALEKQERKARKRL